MKRLLLALLLALPLAAAEPSRIIVNSADWRDVYSGLLYARLKNVPADFLVSRDHAEALPTLLPPTQDAILVLASKNNPFIGNLVPLMEPRGFTAREEYFENLNIVLAARSPAIRAYIIVDDTYGYHALAAAPYAVATRRFVLFADGRKLPAVTAFFRDYPPESVLIFGPVSDEVRRALSPFSPETLDTGDRFEDAIQMAKRFRDAHPTTTAYLSNGEFLDPVLINGESPILFIGRSHTPAAMRAYLASTGLERGILIGDELYPTASVLSRQTHLPIYVQFGEATPRFGQDTSRFRLPRVALDLDITGAAYNSASGALEITVQNTGRGGLYFQHLVTRLDRNETLADNRTAYLGPGGIKTTAMALRDKPEAVRIATIFGDSPGSLELAAERALNLNTVNHQDRAAMRPLAVLYDPLRRRTSVLAGNGGPDAFASADISLAEGGFASSAIVLIPSGRQAHLLLEARQRDVGGAAKVTLWFGERERALLNSESATVPVRTVYTSMLFAAGAILALAIILFFAFRPRKRRRRPREPRPPIAVPTPSHAPPSLQR